MNLSVLRFEIVDHVGVITMNAPPVNALGVPFLEDFEAILGRLSDTREARAVLIASACPGFFSAGDDIASLKEIDEEMIAALPRAHDLLDTVSSQDLSPFSSPFIIPVIEVG